MIRLVIFLLIILLCGCSSIDQPTMHYFYPAEWEPHEAIWIGYGSDVPLPEFDSVTMSMVLELTQFVKVNLVIDNDSLISILNNMLLKFTVDTSKVEYIVQENTGFFYRDPGPIFLTDNSGNLKIADMLWTGYRNIDLDSISEQEEIEEKLDEKIARYLGLEMVSSNVVMEGGAFEVNGKGTIILVEAVTLARNRHLTKQEIEQDILQTLGQEKIIWLQEGLAEDPHQVKNLIGHYYGFGTGGHVDEFCRFANDSTILLCWVPESEKELSLFHQLNYNRMKHNLEILSNATDQDGNKFTIVKVPIPEIQYQEAKITQREYEFMKSQFPNLSINDTLKWVAASSYLNYVVTNGLVLVPSYWQTSMSESLKTKAKQVFEIFEEQFPGREIVQINPIFLNHYGGGMHCMTQQEPKSTK